MQEKLSHGDDTLQEPSLPTDLTKELQSFSQHEVTEPEKEHELTAEECVVQLSLEPGPEQQRTLANITQYAKKALMTDDYSGAAHIYTALAARPEALETLVTYGHSEALSSWDKLTIGMTASSAADALRMRNQPRVGFTDEEPFISEEQAARIAADQAQSELVKKQSSDLGAANYSSTGLLRKYGGMEADGISVTQALQYERYLPSVSRSEAIAEDVRFVNEALQTASPSSKKLLHTGHYNPVSLLRADTYISVAVEGLDPDSPEAAAQALKVAGVLSCNEFAGVEAATGANTLFAEFVSEGATVVGLLNMFPHQDFLQEYVTAEPGEKSEEAKRLIATLAKHPQLRFDDNPGKVASDLLHNPSEFTLAVKMIDENIDRALDTGYPADLASSVAEKSFGVYMSNLMYTYGSDGDSLPQVRANNVKSNFEAMHLLGPKSVELQTLSSGKMPSIDHFMSDLAGKLHDGNVDDIDALREKIGDTGGALQSLAEARPNVYRALIERTTISTTGNVDAIAAYAGMAEKIADRASLTDKLPGSTGVDGLGMVMHGVASKMDYATHTFPKELFSSLDDLDTVISSGAPFDREQLMPLFVGKLDAQRSATFRDLLLSPDVQELTKDPAMTDQVNNALRVLDQEQGNYDLDQAVATVRAIDNPLSEWLSELLEQEVMLGGAQGSEAARELYEVAPKFLSRLDKDGNHYDSPGMVGLVLAPLVKRDGEQHAGDVAWFLEGDMPAAAASSVTFFREDAIKAGIEDTPAAVYEWLHQDPEKTAQLSRHYLEEYLTGELPLADGYNYRMFKLNIDKAREVIEKMGDEVDRSSHDFRIFVNMSPDHVLAAVNGGGKLKTMYDRDIDRGIGLKYEVKRSGIEVALGVRSMDDDAPHAVYGSTGFVGDGIPSGAYGYGEVMATFPLDETLADHATFTPEDSFHGPYRLTTRDAQILRMIKSARGQGHANTSDYIETQLTVPEGVDLTRATQFYVPGEDVAEKLRAGLPADLKDRVVVRPFDGNYRAAREQAVFRSVGLEPANFTGTMPM